MPRHIKVESIEEGMIVSEPVVNSFGQILINSGTLLKKSHEKTLKTWNVSHITVKTDENETELEISEEQKQQARDQIEKFLHWSPKHKIEDNILEMAVLHHCITKQKK